MEERYIKVANNEFERIFVGGDEIGFGFVGEDQFFGQLMDSEYTPSFSEDSIFKTSKVVSISETSEYICSYEWYYNDTKSLVNATKISADGRIITLPNECFDYYICCKVTYSKKYYYGSNVATIFSDTRVQDGRQAREIQILFSNQQNVYVGEYSKETLLVNPSTDLKLSDLIVVGDNIPKDFITISQENGGYKITFDGRRAEIGQYNFRIASKANQNYTYSQSRQYRFEVLGTRIDNISVTLSGSGQFGESLVCVPLTSTSGVSYQYEWYVNGNKIDNDTNILDVTSKEWIGLPIKCYVIFTKDGYKPTGAYSQEVTITKGTRELSWIDYNSENIIYVIGDNTVVLNYDVNTSGGRYSITDYESPGYFTIHNDTLTHTITIKGQNNQMTSFSTIQLYVWEDDEYFESNIIRFKIQTLSNIWDDIVVRLSDNTQVGNELKLLFENNSDGNYELQNIKWYTISDANLDFKLWNQIPNESGSKITLLNEYRGQYIGCTFSIVNTLTNDYIEMRQVSNLVYMVLTIDNKLIDGILVYGQKLNTVFDVFDQNGQLISGNS